MITLLKKMAKDLKKYISNITALPVAAGSAPTVPHTAI